MRSSWANEPSRAFNDYVLLVLLRLIAKIPELADGRGDGVVQTTVEGPELVDIDRRGAFEGQVRNGLAEIAEIVHNPAM